VIDLDVGEDGTVTLACIMVHSVTANFNISEMLYKRPEEI
jgi:hypothetical protein